MRFLLLRIAAATLAVAAGPVARSAAQSAPTEAVESAVPEFVDVSFDAVDLRVFLKIVSSHTGHRFIVDPEVSGTVTLISPDQVPTDRVYPLAIAVLESRGLAVVETEDATHVLPRDRAIAVAGPTPSDPAIADRLGIVTRIYPAANVPASELATAIQPLAALGKESVRAFSESNQVLITDTAANCERLLKIVSELDIPGAGRTIEVIELQHAPAAEIAADLNEALRVEMTPEERIRRSVARTQEGVAGDIPIEVRIVPEERGNLLLVVGTAPEIERIRTIVERLDIETPTGSSRLNAIFLDYLDPEQTSEMLNNLLAKKLGKEAVTDTAIDFLPGSSAIIVDAPPKDFEVIRQLVRELDRPQDQVLVEVMIAEVTLKEGVDIGVEMASIEEPKDGQATFLGRMNLESSGDPIGDLVTQGIFPQGLAFGAAKGTYINAEGIEIPLVPVLVQALAENGRFKILSNPMLWAQNHTTASFNVVEEIPILTSTIEGGSGTARDVIQNIDRVPVGIKLEVRPHITPGGFVQLELKPTVEAILDTGDAAMEFTPTVARREVENTVTIADGDTIVISGLLRDTEREVVRKVPILGDIPLIGLAFRRTKRSLEQTNLVVLITPHVVRSSEDAARISRLILEHNPAAEFATTLADRAALETPETSESPSLEVPSLDVPSLDVPSLDVPSLDVPSLDVPSLDVPSLDVPSLDVPSTEPSATGTEEILTGTPTGGAVVPR